MSTRCHIGTGPLEDFKGFYIHSDGYPDTKIPQLVAWLTKNGYSQFKEVINKSDGAGGSGFDGSLDPNSLVNSPYEEGRALIRGRQAALDQEYTYVVNNNDIDVYNWGKKLGSVDWQKFPKREILKYIFDSDTPDWALDDGTYHVIGRITYKNSKISG